LNQGKKSRAHRSTPLKTHDRRVLGALYGTICGVPAGTAPPARPLHARYRATRAGRRGEPRTACATLFSIVMAFMQQMLPE
jgi:hypothetical protein